MKPSLEKIMTTLLQQPVLITPSPVAANGEQRFVLHDVFMEAISRSADFLPESAQTGLTYDRGTLGFRHSHDAGVINYWLGRAQTSLWRTSKAICAKVRSADLST